jgi:hypothetical protein
MLKQLIHDKINEIFAEYQEENNITSGDIDPFDALELDNLEDALEQLVEKICAKQPKAINFDNLTPSWYIYIDSEGTAHSKVYADSSMTQFLIEVSHRIAHDDITDDTVLKIYYKGKELFYAGWQPCMKYEYKDLGGNTVWVGQFPEWDH